MLAAFQGSHRFHNFGSGLRAADETPGVPRLFYESGGESWPLGLDPRDESQATAFRSVVRSRGACNRAALQAERARAMPGWAARC